jgi:hypothetical protein
MQNTVKKIGITRWTKKRFLIKPNLIIKQNRDKPRPV